MYKFVVTVFLLSSTITMFAQRNYTPKIWNKAHIFNLRSLLYRDIPSEIEFKGKFVEALTWNDKRGENLLILSKNAIYTYPYSTTCQGPESDFCMGGEIYVYLFRKYKNKYRKLWRIYDYLDQWSGGDFHIDFIENTLSITDLDGDQVAEVMLGYDYACRYDASPATMKIIAYESNFKYALRGHTVLSEKAGDMKNYEMTENLKQFTALRVLMEQKWMEVVNESAR